MTLSRIRRSSLSWLGITAAAAAVVAGVLVMTHPAADQGDETVASTDGVQVETVNPGHKGLISGNG